MRIIKKVVVVFVMLAFFGNLYAAVSTPYPWDQQDEVVQPVMRLAGESMGGFFDAMKSYIIYTAGQHVPGAKESGVGYYYDNKTKRQKRILFYRIWGGYARRTDKRLDFKIEGDGMFEIQLPGGHAAYTHDGRFELDENGRLVMMAHNFPLMGENGEIFLPDKNVQVTEDGAIYHNGALVDVIKVVWFKDKHKLNSFNQSIFHFSEEDLARGDLYQESKYYILQGFVEDATVTKGYIGLVPEWKNGHESQVKVIQAYKKNMSLAIQQADPR
ncbi:hypothetical protein DID77_02325 [Candidatus Marinamargulisbacteria bacterium SCGC AG-439-L15]|nr:hypothetical protein DID77_02325 [Candidatus Marinamargulisbacteria bacterium SCGC AG-439-L15]